MKRNRNQKESACLFISDIHYGKKTSTFNAKVCAQRFNALGKRLARIRDLLAGYDFDELVIAIAGDANDGTDIYPTQTHHQDESDVQKQAKDLSKLIANLARSQLDIWDNVRIECVPGNHGRGGWRAHEAANWDITTYNYTEFLLENDGIPVNQNAEGDPFIRKFQVRKHNYLLYHGHAIRSYGNIPWYGMMLRVVRWSISKLAPFEVAMMGHFHTCGLWPINNVDVMIAGTMVTDDDWSLQTFGLEAVPKWWLFGISDSRPITWQYRLDLTL